MNTVLIISLVLLALIFIVSRIKLAQDQERFCIFILGKYKGLKGPGIFYKFSGGEVKWVRLRLGDKGHLLSKNIARFQNNDIPIISHSKIEIGSNIQITGFENDKIIINQSLDQGKTIKCEKCGHKMVI